MEKGCVEGFGVNRSKRRALYKGEKGSRLRLTTKQTQLQGFIRMGVSSEAKSM